MFRPCKKSNNIFLTIFCIALISLHINSAAWLRSKLASHYENKGDLVKAIRLYAKILRKDSVKKGLDDSLFVKTNFDLAYLYGKLDLPNLAIESYAKGSYKLSQIDLNKYYTKTDFAQ